METLWFLETLLESCGGSSCSSRAIPGKWLARRARQQTIWRSNGTNAMLGFDLGDEVGGPHRQSTPSPQETDKIETPVGGLPYVHKQGQDEDDKSCSEDNKIGFELFLELMIGQGQSLQGFIYFMQRPEIVAEIDDKTGDAIPLQYVQIFGIGIDSIEDFLYWPVAHPRGT